MAGVFQMDLMYEYGYEYKHDIICNMQKKILKENTPTICKLQTFW